eukprot:scaffold16159_cov43-Attheya_sp.AAC.1
MDGVVSSICGMIMDGVVSPICGMIMDGVISPTCGIVMNGVVSPICGMDGIVSPDVSSSSTSRIGRTGIPNSPLKLSMVVSSNILMLHVDYQVIMR